MCGIAGFQGDFDRRLLERMSSSVAHRGPDDTGLCWDAEALVGLAHRRLAIIDLTAAARQPMWDATGTVCVTFNGEIYNFAALREELVANGYAFRSRSDAEVLVNLYLRDGNGMLGRLDGMFAFALYDTRDRSLLLARDGIGVKPLYYCELPKGFLFASELKAILLDPSVPRDLDCGAVRSYLTYLWAPSPVTMIEAVRKLEPGCAIRVADGRAQRHWRFYELPYHQPIEPIPEREALRQYRALLDAAVKRQMVADVPVGAFLSGGCDSASVAAMARKHANGEKLQCFTVDAPEQQDEGFVDDLPYARQAARHLGVDLHVIRFGGDMADLLPKAIYHLDEPQADLAPISVWLVSRLAREHGIKVLLSGAGGDDFFTGYRAHRALMLERFWSWLPSPVRKGMKVAADQVPPSIPALRRLSRAFQYADLDGDARIASYLQWTEPRLREDLYGSYLREKLAGAALTEPLLDSLAALGPEVPPLNRLLYLHGRHFLADHNLNYTDKMSMSVGVEVRVPFADPELVAFAARLPLGFKQRGSVGKWIMKKAMEPYLPLGVLYRSKTGFAAPVRTWVKRELAPMIQEFLSPERVAMRGLFDPAAVKRTVDLNRQGTVDASFTVLSLLCIELWCTMFVDGPVPVAGV
ncbi:MAG: asparagine synthase (glutamine-hydrolyzing) [Thermodesulfobacteriota bacterium]